MRHFSRKEIEKIGDRVFKAYCELPEIKGSQIYRVYPEILARELLHLTLEYCHLSLDGSVLGVTSFTPVELEIFGLGDEQVSLYLDGKTILVEKDLRDDISQRGRCNFTIAHEASHQIFKMLGNQFMGAPLHFYKPRSETRKPISDWTEWQTNTLTSAILLHEDLVGKAIYTFQMPEKIAAMDKIADRSLLDRFTGAADFLGVSKSAFAIRLKQLGILDRNYPHSQYSLVDVFDDEPANKKSSSK